MYHISIIDIITRLQRLPKLRDFKKLFEDTGCFPDALSKLCNFGNLCNLVMIKKIERRVSNYSIKHQGQQYGNIH